MVWFEKRSNRLTILWSTAANTVCTCFKVIPPLHIYKIEVQAKLINNLQNNSMGRFIFWFGHEYHTHQMCISKNSLCLDFELCVHIKSIFTNCFEMLNFYTESKKKNKRKWSEILKQMEFYDNNLLMKWNAIKKLFKNKRLEGLKKKHKILYSFLFYKPFFHSFPQCIIWNFASGRPILEM